MWQHATKFDYLNFHRVLAWNPSAHNSISLSHFCLQRPEFLTAHKAIWLSDSSQLLECKRGNHARKQRQSEALLPTQELTASEEQCRQLIGENKKYMHRYPAYNMSESHAWYTSWMPDEGAAEGP